MTFVLAACMALTLLLALWVDRRWGEPPVAVHPVVWMGNYLKICGRVTVRCPPPLAFALGALAWALGAASVVALAWGLQALAFRLWAQAAQTLLGGAWPEWRVGAGSVLMLLLMGAVLKTLFSWRMLRDETSAVEAALQQSLTAGRERLSWLVSRETAALSESEVRESAIESLAENLNDSVVAPIFWFVLLGLPGAALYRFANTADAMWGYRGVRHGVNWEWAGKWAAWADDALSWLPARLTAGLLALVVGGLGLRTLRREAGKTPSPNSGWPMAAMALALGVALRKPGVYTLNPAGRAPQAQDTALAQKYASKALLALIPWALVAMLLIVWAWSLWL